nr:MAG TPA: hypothetical protein [Caudoviricetes sp.]
MQDNNLEKWNVYDIKLKHVEEANRTIMASLKEIEKKIDSFLMLQKELVKVEERIENLQNEQNQIKKNEININDKISALETNMHNGFLEMSKSIVSTIEENTKIYENREFKFNSDISKLEERVKDSESWIERAKGNMNAIMVIGGIIQVAIFSAISWVFTNMTTLKDNQIKLQQEVYFHTKMNPITPQKNSQEDNSKK